MTNDNFIQFKIFEQKKEIKIQAIKSNAIKRKKREKERKREKKRQQLACDQFGCIGTIQFK